MASEYTITLTVREVEGGLSIEQRSELGNAESMASVIAHALNTGVEREICRVKSRAVEFCAEYAKASKTIH
ncbi:hypothetical protein D3C78_744130 [compost metagenome]